MTTAEEARAATRKALEDKESEVGKVLDKIGEAILREAKKANTSVDIEPLLKGLNREQLAYIFEHLRVSLGFSVESRSDVREGSSTIVRWNLHKPIGAADYYNK